MIALAVYLVVIPLAFRRVWPFFEQELGDAPDPLDRAMGVFLGLLVAAFWPLLVVGWFLWRWVSPAKRRSE